jgi:pyruvate dehydrogenase E2 component (dihydrolipoamide acetyltransferase)
MSQGNIISWKKTEGDSIQPGDIYCEVETDKATIEWEAQEEGFLAKILKPAGTSNIDVGVPVAVIVEEEGDVAAFKDYTPGSAPATEATSSPAASSAAPAASASASSSSSSFPAHEILSMPALSPTMTMGNIIAWRKKAGDEVAAGDIIAEVETDKATIEWEAQEEGVIAKILVPDGSNGIDVGSPVLVMVDDKDSVAAFEGFTAGDAGGAPAAAPAASKPEAAALKPAAAAAPAAAETRPKAPSAAPSAAPGSRIIASPYAKKLASEASVSLDGVGGSGPKGRIVAADVQNLVASGGARPAVAAGAAPTSAYTDVQASQIRKITARRLLESKQNIPHYYLTISCRIDRLTTVRASLNATLASTSGGKLSMNDFVVKASALALKAIPEVNSSWHGDFIRQYHSIDCSIAVQTPAGLMVPIVRNADRKGLAAISSEVRDLAGRAKDGKLAPEEFTGGTFTVSNLGMFGVNQFAAIVNPPQACILAVGSAEKKVVPSTDGANFEQGTFMNVTLSCDHRVVDGAVGAQWLKAFKGYIEDPASMLL